MAHTNKVLEYTINCFIIKNDKVLLIFNKKYNSWFGPGGHIEKDEDPETTIYREMEEETGIKKSELELLDPRNSLPKENIFSDMGGMKSRSVVTPTFTDIHQVSKEHTHVAYRFFLTTDVDPRGSKDKFVTNHKWFTERDLDDPKYNLKKHVKFYAKYALKIASRP